MQQVVPSLILQKQQQQLTVDRRVFEKQKRKLKANWKNLQAGKTTLKLEKKTLSATLKKLKSETEDTLKEQQRVCETERRLLKLARAIKRKKKKLNKITTETLKIQNAVVSLKKKLVTQNQLLNQKEEELAKRENEVEKRETEWANNPPYKSQPLKQIASVPVLRTNTLGEIKTPSDKASHVFNRAITYKPRSKFFRCDSYNCIKWKTFTNFNAFRRHIDLHTGQIYPCQYCSVTFARHDFLRRHLGTVHKLSIL